MEYFQQKFNEFKQLFNTLTKTQFENYDDEDSDCYQAYYQAYQQLDLTIRALRKTDKTAFNAEVRAILQLWASQCGCWMDLDIENKLLQPLIDEGFLSLSEITFYNQHIGYRQG